MVMKAVVTVFLLLNSIGTLPIFIALTNGTTFRERARIACVAGTAAVVLLLGFVWSGSMLLTFFGLSIPAFSIGGGIILFRIGSEMLNASVDLDRALRHIPESITRRSSAIVPLGIPLLAGPGSIAVVMGLTMGKMRDLGPSGISLAIAIAAAASIAVWLVGSHLIARINIKSVSELLTRLSGFFLVVLAVQMVLNGWREAMG